MWAYCLPFACILMLRSEYPTEMNVTPLCYVKSNFDLLIPIQTFSALLQL